jgi:hypothetical protein
LPCYFSWFNADGVIFIFVSAAAVSEDRLTAAKDAVLPAVSGISEKPKENIARPRREKGITGKQKIAVDTA